MQPTTTTFTQTVLRLAARAETVDTAMAQELRQAAVAYERDYQRGVNLAMAGMGAIALQLMAKMADTGDADTAGELQRLVMEATTALLDWFEDDRRAKARGPQHLIEVLLIVSVTLGVFDLALLIGLFWIVATRGAL